MHWYHTYLLYVLIFFCSAIGIWRSQTNERRIGTLTETMNVHGIEEMTMATVNVIVIERKTGMVIANAKVIDIGTAIVTEENVTGVNVGLGREIVEAVIGIEIEIEEVVIGIMTANEIGRESTLDGLGHEKESGRGKFQASVTKLADGLETSSLVEVLFHCWFALCHETFVLYSPFVLIIKYYYLPCRDR